MEQWHPRQEAGPWQRTQRPAKQRSNGEPSAGHQRALATSHMQVPRHVLSRSSNLRGFLGFQTCLHVPCTVSLHLTVSLVLLSLFHVSKSVLLMPDFLEIGAVPGRTGFVHTALVEKVASSFLELFVDIFCSLDRVSIFLSLVILLLPG